jgi:hypothetical protein
MNGLLATVAYALIVDPKDEDQGEGFPQSRPGRAVEKRTLENHPLCAGVASTGVKSVTLFQGRHPAVTNCTHKRTTFCTRVSNSGMRFVSKTNSQISFGCLKTTISFSGKQSPPASNQHA